MDNTIQCVLFFIVFSFADVIMRYLNVRKQSLRWFILHIITNFFVCLFTFNDVIDILQNPSLENNESYMVSKNVVFVLHFYHMVMFSNLQLIDWMHHVIMMLILLTPYYYPVSTLSNYLLFFLNGLPGGLDYLMLVLLAYNKIDKLTEKKVNSYLNAYLRGPGIVIGTYIAYLNYFNRLSDTNVLILSFSLFGMMWNAQYFTYRVVYNYSEAMTTKNIVIETK